MVLVLHFGHCLYSTPPPGEKQSWICLCLSFVPFMLGLVKGNVYRPKYLLLFLECASRLQHVGLNKYFWHIYKVTMTFFTTRHIQGGGGVRATFFNSEGAKINDSLGPPGVRPPGYAPDYHVITQSSMEETLRCLACPTQLNRTFESCPIVCNEIYFAGKGFYFGNCTLQWPKYVLLYVSLNMMIFTWNENTLA